MFPLCQPISVRRQDVHSLKLSAVSKKFHAATWAILQLGSGMGQNRRWPFSKSSVRVTARKAEDLTKKRGEKEQTKTIRLISFIQIKQKETKQMKSLRTEEKWPFIIVGGLFFFPNIYSNKQTNKQTTQACTSTSLLAVLTFTLFFAYI